MGGLTILRAICLGSAVYWISRAAEAALSSDGEFSSLAWAFGSLIALQVCGAFCQFLSDEFQRKFLERTETDSLRWAMQNLLLLPAGYFRKANASRFVVQIDRLLQAVRGCLNAVLTGATRVSAITGIVLGVLPIAPIPVSVGVGIIGIVILISFRRSAALGEISRQRMGNEVSLIDNLLHVAASYRDHLNYGLGREALNQMQEKCEELANQSLRINTIQARIRLILKLAGVAVIVAVLGAIVWSGAAPQDALACFAALGLLLEPLSELTRVRANLMVHRFEAGELLDFFNSDLELRGEPPVISVAGGCFDPTMAGPDGEISDNFSQINALSTESVAVSFDSVPVLENISIRAVCGEILGILGPSGAGKTTLINVILGFQQPDSGILKINDRAVESVARESYWQLVYYRPQAPLRTGGSIDDEISTARPQATRSELDDAVNSMQLDTGGNKELSDHMIERARMKLRCPRVVILDEPTSLLNENQELEFCRNLRDDADDRITILVSHRPGTLTICDRLIVLKMGRIVAEGTPAQIIPLHMNCVERKAV